ncbi:MAG: tetraacyldisaccharide 4'-kinase [Planctomycetes bacterium]|nr:tetraacyldisaccharide 4'-kinase [Planctomycetota bacterium]
MGDQEAGHISDAPSVATRLRRAALAVAAAPYALAMRIRRRMYRGGVFASEWADVPVICVGNITTGGTGKTPMVAWVVRHLQSLGKKPAILTRGYKAVAGISDEAELLKKLTGAAVIVNGDRIAGARRGASEGADVLVMDDGFQHMRLRRDLNIVMIDATNPFANGFCLPSGRLREPISALSEAHCIVISRSDMVSPESLAALRAFLDRSAPAATVCTAIHKPVGIIDENGVERGVEALAGRKIFLFCAIGNPGALQKTAASLQGEIVALRAFRDHSQYTASLMESLFADSEARGAELLVTTQKDFVKLADFPLRRPVWRILVEMEVTAGRDELIGHIEQSLDNARRHR